MLDVPDAEPVAGGTILGIHNLAIVFPQFIVRFRVPSDKWIANV